MQGEEKNAELDLAWDYVTKTSKNVFLTGKAGTGKTTFLKRVVAECPKRKVVLAPTGVAAINAGGVTLHSFFQLPFGLFLPEFQHVQAHDKNGRYKFHKKKRKLIQSMELMIIDEVSMLRADVMDELDQLLRNLRRNPCPFGGVQVLMIGDIQQLSPVVKDEEWSVMSKYYPSPYFFDSKVLTEHEYRLIELRRIYRQKDPAFIEILGAVREGQMTRTLLDKLNSRYMPDYEAPDGCITLCTHNSTAKSINDTRLQAIDEPEFTFQASITGNFPESMYPQEIDLVLKKGAQVMFTKNDPNPEKLYVNGTLGKVVAIDQTHITVRLDEGGDVEVEELSWENLKYDINEETKEIVSAVDGLFTQYPLKTAWAITIHKSQGLTFDKAVIDAAHSFSHGQVYVALSRCRTLEGMVLKNRLSFSSIIKDYRVEEFNDQLEESLPSKQDLEADRRAYYLGVLKELYNLEPLKIQYFQFLKFARVTAFDLYPKALAQWISAEEPLLSDIVSVAGKFCRTLDRIAGEDYRTSGFLQERVRKASAYFLSKASELLLPLVKSACAFDFDDQLKKKLYKQYFLNFTENLFADMLLWNYTTVGFTLESFLKERSILSAELPDMTVPKLILLLNRALEHPGATFVELQRPKAVPQKGASEGAVPVSVAGTSADASLSGVSPEGNASVAESGVEDIQDPELFKKLRDWRSSLAKDQKIPAYCILHQKPLVAIVNSKPSTEAELLAIKGVGKSFVEKYASEVLEIVNGAPVEAPARLF